MKNPKNLIASCTRGAGITSVELGFLLDLDGSSVSRLVNGRRKPLVHTVLALEVLFDKSGGTLFFDLYEEVEEKVMRRAAALERKLRNRTDKKSALKLRFVEGVAKRARTRREV